MQGEELIALTAMFAGMALILPLALAHGMHQAQETSEAWRKLAYRHRLDFKAGSRVVGKTSVTGSLGGREFLLNSAGGSNNKQPVYMELALNGDLPDGLRLQAKKPNLEGLSTALGVPLDETADSSEDVSVGEHLKIRANQPEDIPEYLTTARGKAARLLADIGGELEHRKLRVAVTKHVADLEELDKALRALARVAPILDTRPGDTRPGR